MTRRRIDGEVQYCGEELKKPRKLNDFCSNAHRGAHTVKAFDGPEDQNTSQG
jgi:hypothetical protein